MQTFSSDYFCRYYMLFFEKFIKDIPNIPLSHLAKWRKFKNLISQNPPIQSLHNFLIKIFECESTLSLEQMETKFLEKPKKLTIEIDIEPNDEQDQTRKIISPLHKKSSPITGNSKQIRSNVSNEIDNEKFMELKTALVQPELIIKNFRSVTMDFGKGRLFNPFLEQKSTSKNETNAINSRKISEDEQEKSSPMILKVTKNEINHCEASKFKKLETKKTYNFNKDPLVKKIKFFQNMFIKNNEILETIGEKSFEVSTPLNLNGKKISSFSSDIEIPSQMDFGNQIFPFLLPSMKRKSIYSKLPQNKLNILNNLDNELSLKNANDHKIIYK